MNDGVMKPDPSLYPELAAEDGSLVAALRVTSGRLGLSLVDLNEAHAPEGLSTHFAAAVEAEFGDARLELTPEHREVKIAIEMPLIGVAAFGSTASLDVAVEIAHAWQSGTPLADMSLRWKFLRVSPEAVAHDQGRGVEYEWAAIRRMSPDLIDQELVEAAYATPELRSLFPRVTHGSLQFRRRTISTPGSDVPSIFPAGEGIWRVIRLYDPSFPISIVDTAEEAVGLVVAGLPAGCGPAIEVIYAARHGS
ncbi:DUF6193 family natural product biosynthesis protein [Streptomyces sp. 3211.6]|uniref:DUF6193 family natural product biosynthesis protein n=1 Tax=Streptomyces sp. 3211.6 TaxID=1938845 RepID=UPI0011E5E4C7|nr:DUF6193 family natural product biosynthesis protein [Streptomyces sp. 3211.6]